MSAVLPEALTAPLAAFLNEEEDEGALRRAAELARSTHFDLAALFDWLHRYPAARERKTRAEVVLRAALGLPLVPGPPCRAAPH